MQFKLNIGLFLALLAVQPLSAQSLDTTMTVDFQVTTSSPGGNYSPRNIGAIWIEDQNGQFLQTLKRWANNRRQYLYTWNSRSGGNVIDGVTGATYSSHQTHSVHWDFTNFSGDTVAPGEYVLWIELTDQHSQGPLFSFTFPHMGSAETLWVIDQPNFHNMSVSYNLDIIVGIDGENSLPNHPHLSQNFPNPFNPETFIQYSLAEDAPIDLAIYDIQGHKIRGIKQGLQPAGSHSFFWDGRSDGGQKLGAGIYFCRLNILGDTQSIKMALIK